MLIALDYDRTFTADPAFWRDVVALGERHGHSFVCVTGRRHPPEAPEPRIPMPVICAGPELKRNAAARAGHAVDVWIDDMPGTIEPQRIVEWPAGCGQTGG